MGTALEGHLRKVSNTGSQENAMTDKHVSF